jgi:ABC-type bacteriocin/lantibiotic exporter with double-glycine peptidase domain
MMQYQNARTSLNSIDNYMKMPVERSQDKEYVSRPNLQGRSSSATSAPIPAASSRC